MSSKKSPYFVFLDCYRSEEIDKGNKVPSFEELAIKLSPIWNTMTDEEKDKYKVLARNYNSTQAKKLISNQEKNSYDFWNMQKYLTNMFECIPNNEELLNKKFILLHINCHTHDGEQYYFPAEIAALEFSLINGISRTYHQIIGIFDSIFPMLQHFFVDDLAKIYPRGFAGSMRHFSDLFHQILCFNEHPDDYQQILLEFLTFLKDGKINHADLQEGTMDLPYLFTIESEIGTDMIKTKNSLDRLYSTTYPKVDAEHCRSIFKIGSIEKLLLEIKKKLNLDLDPQSLRSGNSIRNILESDMFGYGLGCEYHTLRDISYKCSKSRVIQWMSNICKYICENTGLTFKPGRHAAVQLKDGSKLIIENAHLPLTKKDLHIV